MLTALRGRLRADDGITLIELMVAMTVTAVLGAVTIIFFVTVERTSYKAMLTSQATGDARNALDSWTSMLRVAGWLDPTAKTDRFEEITPTKIVFYANLNNRTTADQTLAAPTKVALMLRVKDPTTGEGQLIQVIFGPDNTTVQSVRQLALDVMPTGSATVPIFQPLNEVGGAVDVANTNGCESGNTPVAGLCLQNVPSNAGMRDPQVAASSLNVTGGPLRNNPDSGVDVDSILSSIGGITIAFTATDSMRVASTDFTSTAAVNSGFQS